MIVEPSHRFSAGALGCWLPLSSAFRTITIAFSRRVVVLKPAKVFRQFSRFKHARYHARTRVFQVISHAFSVVIRISAKPNHLCLALHISMQLRPYLHPSLDAPCMVVEPSRFLMESGLGC
jgi:hypothetical protein